MQVSVDTEAERQRTIHEMLRKDWDPIGVGQFEEAHDEYDAYAPAIYNLMVSEKSRDEIISYLSWLETEQIGMPGDHQGVERFADRLIALRANFMKAR